MSNIRWIVGSSGGKGSFSYQISFHHSPIVSPWVSGKGAEILPLSAYRVSIPESPVFYPNKKAPVSQGHSSDYAHSVL
jgi:hypothetical protein